MTGLVLATKIAVPAVRPAMVSRPRLIQQLGGSSRGRRLTLLSASAGYGKTILLAEWARACPVPVAWLSVDPGDNDPVRFWTYVIAALQTVAPGVGEASQHMLQSPQMSPVEAILGSLINDLAHCPNPVVLILDDYHHIAAQAIHDGLTFLIDHLAPPHHIIVSTRSDPPLPLPRLRAADMITELRQDDLQFLTEEASDFLRRVMGVTISADDVERLRVRTEGWAAGLQMAALSLRGHADTTQFVRTFAGSNRFVLDYLVEEVLQRLPSSTVSFLLQTAVADLLTGALCDALTDRDDGEAMLEALERANVFVVPLDDERRWYRYHRLFADLLRHRLEHDQPNMVPSLHRRASAWYERNGLPSAAIDHALAAGDADRAAGLIEVSADATLGRGEYATFLQWVEALPDEVTRSHSRLRALQGGTMMLRGRPLDVVEACLQAAAPDESAAGEVATFRAAIATFRGDGTTSLALSRQALEQLPADSLFLRNVATSSLGMALLLTGDTEKAAAIFLEAAALGQKLGNIMGAVSGLANVGGMYTVQGRLRRAGQVYRQALAIAVDSQGRPLPVASRVLMGLGDLERQWNELDAAAAHLSQAIALCDQYQVMAAVACYLPLAFVRQAQGDEQGAQGAIDRARDIAARFDASQIDDALVAACQTRLWLAQGNVDAAARWAAERGLEESGKPALLLPQQRGTSLLDELRMMELTTLALVYLAQNRPSEALTILTSQLHMPPGLRHSRRGIEVLVLQARALQAQGHDEAALGVLEDALVAAEPEGYVRVFLDEGEPMAHLLYRALQRGVAPTYVGSLLAAFPAAKAPGRAGEMVEPLSEREIDVLRLIAEGLTNDQIAHRLVISLRTVKWHTGNIYGKLGVENRVQAIVRARALGILPG